MSERTGYDELRLVPLTELEVPATYGIIRQMVRFAGETIMSDFPYVARAYSDPACQDSACARLERIRQNMLLCPDRGLVACVELCGKKIGLVSFNYTRSTMREQFRGWLTGEKQPVGYNFAIWMVPAEHRPCQSAELMPVVMRVLAQMMRQRGARGNVWTIVRTDTTPDREYVRRVLQLPSDENGFGPFVPGAVSGGYGMAGNAEYRLWTVRNWK